MPTFEFQAPGSTDTFQIDARDDAHAQQIIGHIMGAPQEPQTPMEQASGIAKQTGVGAARTLINNIGMGGDIREATGNAIDALASKLRPKTTSDLITQSEGAPPAAPPASFDERFTGKSAPTIGDYTKTAMRFMPVLGGLFFNGPTSEQVQHGVESITGPFRQPQNTKEEYADTIGGFLPAALAGPSGAARSAGGRVAGLLADYGRRLLTNTVIPGAASETAGQTARQFYPPAEPYARFGGAMVSPVLTSAWQTAYRGTRPPNIPPERQAAFERMQALGAGDNISPGQITGDLNRRYREATAGIRSQAQEQASLEDLTKAATRPFGEENSNFHEALSSGHARIGPAIEEAAGRMKVRMDPALSDSLVGLDKATFNEGLNPDAVNRLRAVRDHIVNTFETVARESGKGPDWTELSGKSFQNLIARNSVLQRAIDEGGNVGYYAKRMKDALLDAAERTANRPGTREGVGNRQALEDFRMARRQYANMMAVQEGAPAGGEKAAAGLLTPAAVRQIATNRDKADYFLGRGDYSQLAKDANLLMTPLPNSGTAQRLKSQWPTQLVGGLVGAGLGSGTGFGPAVGAAVGTAVSPAIRGRMVRLKPWWLDQEIANRQHVANLLAADVATQQLTHNKDQ